MQGTLYALPQFVELPKLRWYMARTKLEDRDGRTLNFSFSQANRLVQKLEQLFGPGMIFIPTSEQWTSMHQELTGTEEGIKLMVDDRESLDRGLGELVNSLLAYPNPETGGYSPSINPSLQPSAYPYLIEGATIDFDITKVNYSINEGQRMQLKDFPQKSGPLNQPIPELGLFAGTILFVNPDYGHEEGLRAITRGGYRPNPDKRGIGQEVVSACFLPSSPSPLTGLRICSIEPVRADPERYTTILKEILS